MIFKMSEFAISSASVEALAQKHGLLEKALFALSQESEYFKHGLLAAAERIERSADLPASDVRYLASKDNDLFTLTQFASVLENIVQLESESDSIVQEDGIFQISGDLETSSVQQDESFLELVNSVIS